MKLRNAIVLMVLVVFGAAPHAGAIVWEWNTPGNVEGWTAGNAITSVAASGGELIATYNGAGDPYIWSPPNMGLDASRERVLITSLELIASGIGTTPQDFQIFYRRNAHPGDPWEAHSFHFSITPNVGKRTYIVKIPEKLAAEGKPADWSGSIDQFRYDIGAGYAAGSTCRIDYMAVVAGLDWEYNTAGDTEGWVPNGQIDEFNVAGGELEVGFQNISSTDPFMSISPTFFDATAYKYVKIEQDPVNHNGDEGLGGQIFGFPSTIAPWTHKGWSFYPNIGGSTIIIDMSTGTSGVNGGLWAGLGSITTWRIDNTTDPLTNWQPNGRIYYDHVSVLTDPSDPGPYQWDFSGSGPGTWRAAKHSPYGGTNVNIAAGQATVTGSGTLGMANYDMAVAADPYKWLVFDVDVNTTAPRSDFLITLYWAVDGGTFNAGRRREYTLSTNIGTNRYVFDLTSVGSGAGSWDGFVHGLLFQLGNGEAGINSITFDNVEIVENAPPYIQDIADTNVNDGSPYSQTPTLLAGAPANWSLIAPASPPGDMAINGTTGQVTWTATYADSPVDVTIRATNAHGSDDESWRITVDPLVPVIDPIGDENVTDGQVYSRTPSLSQGSGTITWSLVAPSPAPGDMQVNGTTGELTWTATYADSPVDVTIQATGPGGPDTEDWRITVDPLAPVIAPINDENVTDGQPYSLTPSLSQGSGTITWSLVAPSPAPGDMQVNGTTGELTWTADYDDSPVDVTIQATGPGGPDTEDWRITVDPLAPIISPLGSFIATDGQLFSQTPALIQGSGTITWSLDAPSPAPGDMLINVSTGQVTWTANYADSPVDVVIRATGPGGTDTEDYDITVNPVATIIAPIDDENVPDGAAYSKTATLSQGTQPITWSLVAPSPAPGDMQMNSSTGELTWAATYADSPVDVIIQASGPGGSDTDDWRITVDPVQPIINPIDDENVTDGQPYSKTPTLSQGTAPVTWTLVVPASPPGDMQLNATTGELTWTATYANSPVNVTIRASGPGGSDTEDWIITVDPVVPMIDPIDDENVTDGQPYSKTPALSQGTQPITWSLVAPSPAPGDMQVNATTGELSWTADYADSPVDVTIEASGPGGTDTEDWRITVDPVAPMIDPIDDEEVLDGGAYTKTPTLSQGTAPIAWSLVAPSPAPGDMAVNPSTGELTWTANIADSPVDVTIEASGPGGVDTEGWRITVTPTADPPVINPIDDVNVTDGALYSEQPTLSQGTQPITWSLLAPSPPPGDMAINPSTGRVTWTADVADSPVDVTIEAAGPGGTDTEDWRITVESLPPVISGVVVDPPGGQVAIGDPVSFTVQLSQGSAPLSYQWKKDGGDIADATDATLAIAVTVQEDEGEYTCVVSNAVDSDTSDPAPLIVGEILSFTDEPENQKGYIGGGAQFSVAISGGRGAIHYQWKFDDGQKAVVDVGEDSPVLDIDPVTQADAGAYWCEVTDERDTYTSASASLEVAAYLEITEHPQSVSKHPGESHTFSVTAEGGFQPLSYQWSKDGSAITDATESSYTIASVEASDVGAYYVDVADNEAMVLTSNTAALTVTHGLPLAGLAGLAILFGACLLAGTTVIRGKK